MSAAPLVGIIMGSDSDLPTTLGGSFTLKPPTYKDSGNSKSYLIDLNNGDYLLIYKYKHFMAVQVHDGPKTLQRPSVYWATMIPAPC